VNVVVDQEDIAQKDDTFFQQFDIVCLVGCTIDQMVRKQDKQKRDDTKTVQLTVVWLS